MMHIITLRTVAVDQPHGGTFIWLGGLINIRAVSIAQADLRVGSLMNEA
ncbi:hypothetical protein [Acidovorax sp.]|nr:hypothetical protein [Acidovorax sp.]